MKKAVRVIILCLVGGLLLTAMIASSTQKPDIHEQVWDERAAIGNENADKHYIMYTDLMCPYCDVFTREVIKNEEEFNQYIADNNILFEVRVTDILYDSVGSEYSKDSAVATYCAKNENRFFDFYHAAVMALYEDYHSKGIGDSKTAPAITNMPEDYWIKIGKKIGLGESFENCYKNQDTLSEVRTYTTKAEKSAQGLPYFVLNGEAVAGYDTTWGWKTLMETGLQK